MLDRVRRVLKRRGLGGTVVMIADRFTRPFGFSLLSFTPMGALPPPKTAGSPKSKFDEIAVGNLWGSSESLSGGGSEVARTERYRWSLIQLFTKRQFKSMFDAPCGDMNWMPLALEEMRIDYLGGDISPSLIERNRASFPDVEFMQFDITTDRFPAADVWHCRDCLFHLSYRDIGLALRNFLRSGIPYALITNHRGLIRNVDIESGGWRYLGLRRPPFNFPAPETVLSDHNFGDLPRVVGLWSRQQIERALSGDSLAKGSLGRQDQQ